MTKKTKITVIQAILEVLEITERIKGSEEVAGTMEIEGKGKGVHTMIAEEEQVEAGDMNKVAIEQGIEIEIEIETIGETDQDLITLTTTTGPLNLL